MLSPFGSLQPSSRCSPEAVKDGSGDNGARFGRAGGPGMPTNRSSVDDSPCCKACLIQPGNGGGGFVFATLATGGTGGGGFAPPRPGGSGAAGGNAASVPDIVKQHAAAF